MEDIERDLAEGNTVMCANIHNCANEIKHGDSYVIRGKYMYCDNECADEDEGSEQT